MTVGIIGGDERYRYLCNHLQYQLQGFGNDFFYNEKSMETVEQLETLMKNNSVIIVPIPFTKNKSHIYAKHFIKEIEIDEFISYLKGNHIVMGGPFTKDVLGKIREKHAKVIDITHIETFKKDNAIPTAEGVLAKIVEKINFTVYNSTALVMGYGYCGKRIAYLLKSLGAKVSVYTESNVEKEVLTHMEYSRFDNDYRHLDYIINTIPVETLSADELSEHLFIDITNAYPLENEKMIKMRGIPGRVSPIYSAKIIGTTINEVIKNLNLEI